VWLDAGLYVVRYDSPGVPVTLRLLDAASGEVRSTVFEDRFGSGSASLNAPEPGDYVFGVTLIRGASHAHEWQIEVEQL
jgi:hypothetical protein